MLKNRKTIKEERDLKYYYDRELKYYFDSF